MFVYVQLVGEWVEVEISTFYLYSVHTLTVSVFCQ
jgi:hypothetical protein